jgi:hypothetical protein
VSHAGPVAVAFAFLLLAGILAAYVAAGWRAGIYKGRGGRVERATSPTAFVVVAVLAGSAAAGTFAVSVLALLDGLRGA